MIVATKLGENGLEITGATPGEILDWSRQMPHHPTIERLIGFNLRSDEPRLVVEFCDAGARDMAFEDF